MARPSKRLRRSDSYGFMARSMGLVSRSQGQRRRRFSAQPAERPPQTALGPSTTSQTGVRYTGRVPNARLQVSVGRTTTVTVDGWPGPASPYHMTTKDDLDLPQRSDLPAAAQQLVPRRSRQGGKAKGRILRCVQTGGPLLKPIVVGLIAYSLSAKVVVVVGVGVVKFKHEADADQIETLMLACAQEIARNLGRDCLRWKVHHLNAAKRAESFGFRRLGRSSSRHRSDRGAILLERCRSSDQPSP